MITQFPGFANKRLRFFIQTSIRVVFKLANLVPWIGRCLIIIVWRGRRRPNARRSFILRAISGYEARLARIKTWLVTLPVFICAFPWHRLDQRKGRGLHRSVSSAIAAPETASFLKKSVCVNPHTGSARFGGICSGPVEFRPFRSKNRFSQRPKTSRIRRTPSLLKHVRTD